MYSIARRTGLTTDEAEDVSQAVFASLLQSLGGLRDGQSLAKWLIVVSKRQSWRIVRARPTPLAGPDGEAPAPHPDDPDDVWARRQAVRQALASLGGRCQELLSALFTDRNRADYAEVSARLGIPVGSIGPTRNRCLRKLLDVLGSMPGSAALWSEAEQAAIHGRLDDPI